MILARTYSNRADIPKGAEPLYKKTGALFILQGATNDFVADNPWDAENWNLTAQGQFISKYGTTVAEAFAKNAGTSVGGLKPKIGLVTPTTQVIVQRRNFTTNIGGGDGSGSSGDGPPS